MSFELLFYRIYIDIYRAIQGQLKLYQQTFNKYTWHNLGLIVSESSLGLQSKETQI